MTDTQSTRIAYVGPAGAGLGFQLSGADVHECASPDESLKLLHRLKIDGVYGIIFVDESLVEHHLEALEKMNEDPLPAIILLPNPSEPKHVAAANLQQLMIRAVGSDIFGENT